MTKSVEELKLLCKEAGIKGFSGLSKRDLVIALIDDVSRRHVEVKVNTKEKVESFLPEVHPHLPLKKPKGFFQSFS